MPFNADETVINMSSHQLSSEQCDALKNGLTHSICPPSIRKSDIYTCFELIHGSMVKKIVDRGQTGKLQAALSHLASSYIASDRVSHNDRKVLQVLKSLKRNKNIVILKPDKGNGVVILDRTVYDSSILNIISDSSKFKKLKDDATLLREGQLQRFLRNLKKNDEIENTIYDKTYPSGSQPARIYGLPKMHKVQDHSSTPPFWPIVSSIGTYNYNLAKYLCTLLNPHIPNDYCAHDTFTFVSEVTRLHTLNKFMVSFDVESLFTNIPLIESIDLAVDYIMKGNPDIKLGRENLTKLFFFATAQTHFSFLGNFYDQIDGVAMGSPLSPVLANLFMGHHEKRWLENYNSGIKFYRRYVDDTFALFNTEQDALSFFSYINSQHPNIKFTMEKEENHKLPFLDVL
ncbi:uncharacterized protein [Montipora capricornis]|uniref:uncharacterized protein n=1 Tax=Montipora capricornis TaxID=246305 RepID=UPI0035F12590